MRISLWNNKDRVIAYLPLGCAFLYAVGGSGALFLRRFILPVFIAYCMFFVVQKWSKAFISLIGVVLLSLMFHLGYGDAIASRDISHLSLLGIGYGMATLPFWLAYSRRMYSILFRITIPTWFVWSIAMSNGWFGYSWEWKISEIGVGLLIGTSCLLDIWGKWK